MDNPTIDGSVYFAFVEYDPSVDTGEGKVRPIVVIVKNPRLKMASVLYITTKFDGKSGERQGRLYKIQNLDAAGLRSDSWIIVDSFEDYTFQEIDNGFRYIGELADEDKAGLVAFLLKSR
jgi:hypothetical protein